LDRARQVTRRRLFRFISVLEIKDARPLDLRVYRNRTVNGRILFRVNISFGRLILLPRICFLLELLLLTRQLELKHARPGRDLGLETVVVDVKVQSPYARILFDCTPAFPAIEREAAVLAGTVKGASPVGLGVGTYSIPDFVRAVVDIDPVHDWRDVGDGRDEPFILCVWIGQIVSCIAVAEGAPVLSPTIDPQFPVPQDNRTPVDFSTSR
jgi:hypothetical protein